MKYLLMGIISIVLMGCECTHDGYVIKDEHGVQRGLIHINKHNLQNPKRTHWVCINGVLYYSNKNNDVLPFYNTDKSLTKCEIIFVKKENKPTVDQYSEVNSSRYNNTPNKEMIIVD